jgi:hypothetical protein
VRSLRDCLGFSASSSLDVDRDAARRRFKGMSIVITVRRRESTSNFYLPSVISTSTSELASTAFDFRFEPVVAGAGSAGSSGTMVAASA